MELVEIKLFKTQEFGVAETSLHDYVFSVPCINELYLLTYGDNSEGPAQHLEITEKQG